METRILSFFVGKFDKSKHLCYNIRQLRGDFMGKSCRIRKQKKPDFNLPTHHRFSAEEVRVIVNGEKAQLLEDVFFRIVALSAMVINDNYGFIAIGWILKPRGEFEDQIDWSKLYGELRKGNYRIVKEVYDNGNKIELCAEFTIE